MLVSLVLKTGRQEVGDYQGDNLDQDLEKGSIIIVQDKKKKTIKTKQIKELSDGYKIIDFTGTLW